MANAQDLGKHLWKERILLLISNGLEDAALRAQWRALQKEQKELRKRDLVVYVLTDEGSFFLGVDGESEEPEPLDGVGRPERYKDGVVLIGKDGTKKMERPFPVRPKDIFNLIDAMPMRRAEMNKNKQDEP
ncbi:DUF4174 domain-containing protein [Maribacter sp. 2307ULW6-5]|uniref:DUF4174 domain-containing protein n=1 Tax=Maribacter sp. 2307ULW6-5 TaxID=3386275 RepID=UPI0039BC7AE8